MNKRIAENLFLRAYEMELDGESEHSVWAYRKAAWTVDELDENLADIYRLKGMRGLIALPSIGNSIARVIISLLEEKSGGFRHYRRTVCSRACCAGASPSGSHWNSFPAG